MVKRILMWISAALCMCICLMPDSVHAVSTSDASEPFVETRECVLTAVYSGNDYEFSGVTVDIYKIAGFSSDLQFSYTSDFEGLRLPLNGVQSAGEWDVLRYTLEAYIMLNDSEPIASGKTDSDGKIRFGDLDPGLYYIPALMMEDGENLYSFSSALVALPGIDPDSKEWDYTVQTKPKPQVIPGITPDEKDEITYKVLKLWKDQGYTEYRPISITVDIYRNGELNHTVRLSGENNWAYSWSAEDDGSIWTVIEREIPEGYIMSVEKRSTAFILTNTFDEQEPEEPDETVPPEEPVETKVPEETRTPDESEETEPYRETEPPDEPVPSYEPPINPDVPVSPQTGDTANFGLYILLMCISGIIMVIIGVTGKRESE